MTSLAQPFGEGLPLRLIATSKAQLVTCRTCDMLDAAPQSAIDIGWVKFNPGNLSLRAVSAQRRCRQSRFQSCAMGDNRQWFCA